MVTWNQNTVFFDHTIISTQQYGQTSLEGFQPASDIQIVGIQMLEKLTVNMINGWRILEHVNEQPLNFISLSLILRSMLTDVIVHNYLKWIQGFAGNAAVTAETNALDSVFVKAYFAIAKAEDDLANNILGQAGVATLFNTQFPTFMNGNEVRSTTSFRPQDLLESLQAYRIEHGIKDRVDTEMGKIEYAKGDNQKQITVAYKYLNQFHHYSPKAMHFYRIPDFESRNRFITALTLSATIDTICRIIDDLVPNEEIRTQLLNVGVDLQAAIIEQ